MKTVQDSPARRQVSCTVHCKLDKVGHRSLCPPRNCTGVVLIEAGTCRVSLKEMSGSSYSSPYSKMFKIVQLLRICCIPIVGMPVRMRNSRSSVLDRPLVMASSMSCW